MLLLKIEGGERPHDSNNFFSLFFSEGAFWLAGHQYFWNMEVEPLPDNMG